MVTIPALPGRGDPGLRLLHRRSPRRCTGLRPGRNRARNPAPLAAETRHQRSRSPREPYTRWLSSRAPVGWKSPTLKTRQGAARILPAAPRRDTAARRGPFAGDKLALSTYGTTRQGTPGGVLRRG